MFKLQNVTGRRWVKSSPPRERNVRNLVPSFWTREEAHEERLKRIDIMRAGSQPIDATIADILTAGPVGKPADTTCCPIAQRRFQIYFVEKALRELERFKGTSPAEKEIRTTVFDAEDAIRFGFLRTIDWKRLHQKLRGRIRRTAVGKVVVIGMGEVEADEKRQCWQPHYHLVLLGLTSDECEELRRSYYPVTPDGLRQMVNSKETSLPGWLAYMSKLKAFRRVPAKSGKGGKRRRLRPDEFREYTRYQSDHQPTEFVFAMGCDLRT